MAITPDQNLLTFDNSKSIAIVKLDAIRKFLVNLGNHTNHPDYLPLMSEFETFIDTIKGINTAIIPEKDVEVLLKVKIFLTHLVPELTDKLTQLWNLFEDIIRNNPNKLINFQSSIFDSMPKIEEIDEQTELVVNEVDYHNPNYNDLKSILLNFLERAEDIDYNMVKQLNSLVTTYNLLNTYDIEEMCSAGNKVANNKSKSKWKTEIRAIRDCVGHRNYKIENHQGEIRISFNNTDPKFGYNFVKTYSFKELVRIFDNYTLLYKIQLYFLQIIEILPIIATHLVKE